MGGFGSNFGSNFTANVHSTPPVPTKTITAELCVTESVQTDLCI